MKVVVKTIQEDLDEQIEKLTAEGKEIACIEMTSAELEQLEKELEPLLHFDIKRVGQGNEYRGYPIRIIDKKKVFLTPLPRPSRAGLFFDRAGQVADEFRNDYIRARESIGVLSNALMEINGKIEIGNLGFKCDAVAIKEIISSALDQVKP